MGTISVIKFLFTKEHKVLDDLLAGYRASPEKFEVEECRISQELATILGAAERGVIVAALRSKDDLSQIANFVKKDSKLLGKVSYKFLVIDYTRDSNFQQILAKMGILDILNPDVATKALKHKLDLLVGALGGARPEAPAPAAKPAAAKAAEKRPESRVSWAPPLDLEDDIWLVDQPQSIKSLLATWTIHVTGPSTNIGRWVRHGDDAWCFDVRETEREIFAPSSGKWILRGQKIPEISWEGRYWIFRGSEFELFFEAGAVRKTKLRAGAAGFEVAKNSMNGEIKRSFIEESFRTKYVFKSDDEGGAGDEPVEVPVDGSPLFDDATAVENEAAVRKAKRRSSYREEPIAGHLSGKLAGAKGDAADAAGGELFDDNAPVVDDDETGTSDAGAGAAKRRRSSYTEAEIPGHLSGKLSKTAGEDAADAGPELFDDRASVDDDDERGSFAEAEIPGHLSGKLSGSATARPGPKRRGQNVADRFRGHDSGRGAASAPAAGRGPFEALRGAAPARITALFQETPLACEFYDCFDGKIICFTADPAPAAGAELELRVALPQGEIRLRGTTSEVEPVTGGFAFAVALAGDALRAADAFLEELESLADLAEEYFARVRRM
jgi:hypothetical protein